MRKSSDKIYQLYSVRKKGVQRVYLELRKIHGDPRKFWPGWCARRKSIKDREEIAIGAILTQRTNWRNVEMALTKFRSCDFLSIKEIYKLGKKDMDKLQRIVRPTGFYHQKAKRLWGFCRMIVEDYGGLESFMEEELAAARSKLLSLWGIGPETADSILLYALDEPSFVVDEYTRRLVNRLSVLGYQLSDNGLSVVGSSVTDKQKTGKLKSENRKQKTDNRLDSKTISYDSLKNLFENSLPQDHKLYQDFHALIVIEEKGEKQAKMI